MAEALALPHVVTDDGWTANIYAGHIEIRVDVNRDRLAAAIRTLLSPTQRRYWSVENADTDEARCFLYVMTRDPFA